MEWRSFRDEALKRVKAKFPRSKVNDQVFFFCYQLATRLERLQTKLGLSHKEFDPLIEPFLSLPVDVATGSDSVKSNPPEEYNVLLDKNKFLH